MSFSHPEPRSRLTLPRKRRIDEALCDHPGWNRYLERHDEIADLDDMIEAIVKDLAPELLEQTAIGLNSAAQLLLTAGDNPERLKSEASFAALCGVSPVPASSRAFPVFVETRVSPVSRERRRRGRVLAIQHKLETL